MNEPLSVPDPAFWSALQRRLKDRLPHAWDAFFARFGRLTKIQAQAIEPLLAGHNCILVAATASGKTEAALAPLLERHKQAPPGGLSLLYLIPTRALARDLARRLHHPLARLVVRMGVKTGDEPTLNSTRPPELLLTTPESLDSLLAGSPRLVKNVRAVILDELHLYDRTPRGDQLRVLLNRLRRIKRDAHTRGEAASPALQFCALSATIPDPAGAAARYFTDPMVVAAAGQRELAAELLPLVGPESLTQLWATLRARGSRKVLIFCHRRAECEEWAHICAQGSPFGDRVFVHHGSLAARVRRAVERDFALASAAICFATSTLELGIDIGDLDLIVLLGPPESTSAFLQRIGRGNRRTSRTSVICLYRTPMEQSLFRIFIRAAQSGELTPGPYFFRPSVVVQQLCSYLKQKPLGELEPESAYDLFTSPDGWPLLARPDYEQIIEHLVARQYFTPARGRALRPGPAWQELYEQRAIYTNLSGADRRAVEVVDEMTGRRLGVIEPGVRPGAAFLFGGQARRATRQAGRKLIVHPAAGETGARAPRFHTPWRPLTPELARALAAELGLPQARDADELAAVVAWPEGRPGDETEAAPAEAARSWVFHSAGDAYGLVLGDLLEAGGRVRVEDRSGLYLVLRGEMPAAPLQFSAEQVRARVRRRWQQFEGWFDLGHFQSRLPLEVRRASVVAAFNVAEFMRLFSGRRLRKAEANHGEHGGEGENF